MSVISRLRKARPYLTPPFISEDSNDALARYRTSDQPDANPSLVMAKPIGNGQYGERVIDQTGKSVGLGTQQDYAPLAPIQPRAVTSSDTHNIWNLGAPPSIQPPTQPSEDVAGQIPSGPMLSMARIGRPRPDASIQDPQARLTDYERQLVNYTPQKEGAGKIIGRAALGFLAHGIPGAVYSAGSDLMDRRALDRNWQQQELGKTEGTIQRIGAQKRQELQDQLTQSEINKNVAETNKTPTISQSRHKITVPDNRYEKFGIKAGDKVWADLNGAPLMQNDQPVLSDRALVRPPPAGYNIAPGQSHVETVNGQPKVTFSLPDRPQPVVPDVGAQNAPDIKSLSDRLTANRNEQKQHEDEIAVKNAAIRKQGEADYKTAFDAWTKAATDYNSGKGPQPGPRPKRQEFYEAAKNNDPDYLDGTVEKVTNRIKELKDSNKQDQTDLEGLQRETRRANQKPRKGRAVSAAPSVTEQQVRDAAKAKGLDPDKAVQRAKSRGMLK